MSRAVGADHPNGWMAAALSIGALAFLASATSLGNGFAYDDRWIIAENAHAHSLRAPWRLFDETYWPNIRGAALYRPLTILLYATQWTLGRGSPALFHAVNVGLNVLVAVAVLWLALQCLPRGAAWVAAALFAVHPVHVEAVGNVVGQAELWSALLMIGSTALYLRDRRAGLPLRRQSAFAIAACYLVGILIKENAIVLPALLVAAELSLVDDPRPWRARAHSCAPVFIWMTLFAAICLWARVQVTGEIGGDIAHPSLNQLGFGQRALVMLGLVPEFGRLFLWPARLYADYSPQLVRVHSTWDVAHLPGALLLLCGIVLMVASLRRWPVVTFGLAWLTIAIAPVSNVLIPTGILIAERTLLLPSVGVVLALGVLAPWVFDRLAPAPRAARLVAAGVFAVLLTLGISKSAERQYTWRSTDTVFTALASDASLSFKAHYALGGRLFELKRATEAEREWRYAIALLPDYFGVYLDLAHRYKEAHVCVAAIPNYQRALALEPSLPIARAGLAACHLELSQWRRARIEARVGLASGYYRRAFRYMIERADSALVANDSLDASNRWKGKATVLRP